MNCVCRNEKYLPQALARLRQRIPFHQRCTWAFHPRRPYRRMKPISPAVWALAGFLIVLAVSRWGILAHNRAFDGNHSSDPSVIPAGPRD